MSAYSKIDTLVQKLSTERANLWAAVRRLDTAGFIRAIGDGWSPKDILAHLGAAEEVNVKFAKLMVSQQRPVQLEAFAADYPDYTGQFSLDAFNAYMTEKLRIKSLSEVMSALEVTRSDTLAWVETLTPDQLDRGGEHAVWGEQTVRGILRILALHDKVHTKDILKRIDRVDG